MIKSLITTTLLFFFGSQLTAQIGYSNYIHQVGRLQKLNKQYPQLSALQSIGKTVNGKDIWMLTLGSGKTETKPAIAIVGGVEGNHLLGTELAIGVAEKILQSTSDSVKQLLSSTTFYVFPNMSPDAMEQFFAPLKYERTGNSSATDDDRDGKVNEDGYDDIDGNGKITMMRVESPIGDYKISAEDPRSLVKADLSKGEKGNYILYTEGIDNDKDGSFNEDGEGGVAFNKNLPFRHPSFTPGSGEFAVSEPESRALLDQLYKLFNVYAVVSFSTNNNLSSPIAFNQANASQRIVSGYLEQDAKINAMVSDLYNKSVNMKDAPKNFPAGGDFLSWAYYHYGRYSFSTPGWYVPKAKVDTTKKDKPAVAIDSISAFLKWAGSEKAENIFTPWKKVQHPDSPAQNVEVGGVEPFSLINPPYSMVNDIVTSHAHFITLLARAQPNIDITNVRKEKLGQNITRITVNVMNTGAMASHSKLGEKSYWVKRINVKLIADNKQTVLSGKKIQVLNSLDGLSSKEVSWLVRGTGKIELEAGSPTTGIKKIEIIL